MAAVKHKDTRPEIKVRAVLHKHGLRYRLHDKKLPGKPDLVFPKYRTVLFIHGCFWHGHPDEQCKLARIPKSNVKFWENKIQVNRQRDNKNIQLLQGLGWNIAVMWECEINSDSIFRRKIEEFYSSIKKHNKSKQMKSNSVCFPEAACS